MEVAVSRAALAERLNKKGRLVRYDHQRRIPRHVLEAVRGELLAADLASCVSFHELFLAVKAVINQIRGVGELMVYDTALRIGARLRLEPEKVYLHAGTREGACRLGLDWKSKWIETAALPEPLRSLPSLEVEDILCIYKDWFAAGEAAQRR